MAKKWNSLLLIIMFCSSQISFGNSRLPRMPSKETLITCSVALGVTIGTYALVTAFPFFLKPAIASGIVLGGLTYIEGYGRNLEECRSDFTGLKENSLHGNHLQILKHKKISSSGYYYKIYARKKINAPIVNKNFEKISPNKINPEQLKKLTSSINIYDLHIYIEKELIKENREKKIQDFMTYLEFNKYLEYYIKT